MEAGSSTFKLHVHVYAVAQGFSVRGVELVRFKPREAEHIMTLKQKSVLLVYWEPQWRPMWLKLGKQTKMIEVELEK